MLETLAFCIVVYDSASLHLSFFEGDLGNRMASYDDAEYELAARMAAEPGADERAVLVAMQDAYARAVPLSGTELVDRIADCDAKFHPAGR